MLSKDGVKSIWGELKSAAIYTTKFTHSAIKA
jgi:hypothetical protein